MNLHPSKQPNEGELAVLSVGEGDIKLSFDPNKPAERIRAARIVKDMLRRGYALMVEVGGKWTRVREFDETVCEYIIADFDPEASHEQSETAPAGGAAAAASEGDAGQPAKPATGKRGPYRKRVPAASAKGVSVAPIAGG